MAGPRVTGGTARSRSKGGTDGPRPRLTGRAAVLVLVLAVLAVSYASSMRAYLDQRAHLDDLRATIATREGEITGLEDERSRWQDPSFVRNQARERLGYVRPGETSYVAMKDGLPVEGEASLDEPGASTDPAPQAWYDGMWESVQVAGDPPTTSSPPADRIDGRSVQE